MVVLTAQDWDGSVQAMDRVTCRVDPALDAHRRAGAGLFRPPPSSP